MNAAEHPSADNPAQAEVFPSRIKLRLIDPRQKMRRFYLMTVQQDLFGGATQIRGSSLRSSGVEEELKELRFLLASIANNVNQTQRVGSAHRGLCRH